MGKKVILEIQRLDGVYRHSKAMKRQALSRKYVWLSRCIEYD